MTLAYRPLAQWLRRIFAVNSGRTLSILDVGSGGGDSLRFIERWLTTNQRAGDLTGVDLNPWSRQYAEAHAPAGSKISYETANIFDRDPAARVDFVMSSLFTHHLSDRKLVRFVEWMESNTERGWFISDLHRHPFPYFFFKYVTALFRFHYMVRHDGPISIARAFTKKDWRRVLAMAGVPASAVEIAWVFPFRYCLTRQKA